MSSYEVRCDEMNDVNTPVVSYDIVRLRAMDGRNVIVNIDDIVRYKLL